MRRTCLREGKRERTEQPNQPKREKNLRTPTSPDQTVAIPREIDVVEEREDRCRARRDAGRKVIPIGGARVLKDK